MTADEIKEFKKEYNEWLDDLENKQNKLEDAQGKQPQMEKPTYDDLVYLISFLWKWSDEPKVLIALVDENVFEDIMNNEFYKQHIKEEELFKASETLWALKEELEKINGFWE